MRASLYGVIVCSVLATACGKKAQVNVAEGTPTTGANTTTAATAAPDAVGAPEGDAKVAPEVDAKVAPEVVAEPPHVPLNNDSFATLVKALGACKLVGTTIDSQCPEAVALQKELAHRDAKLDPEAVSALGLELLTNESPTLRVKGAELLESRNGGGEAGREALLLAFQKETQAPVKLAFMRTIAAQASLNPKAAATLVGAMSDADLDVRANAIYALTDPLNTSLPGLAEAFIKAIESDPEPKLRRVACEHAGKLGDEKLLPVIAKMTEAKSDPEMQESCMRGLIAMWADYPWFNNASERAYRMTLRLLERKPRTTTMPSWAAIASIASLAKLKAPESQMTPGELLALRGWKARSKGWYDEKALQRPLFAIALDANVSDLAVAKAVEALNAVGASKEQIEALHKQLSKSPRTKDDGPIAKAFMDVLHPELINRAGVVIKPPPNQQGVKINGPAPRGKYKITGPNGEPINPKTP